MHHYILVISGPHLKLRLKLPNILQLLSLAQVFCTKEGYSNRPKSLTINDIGPYSIHLHMHILIMRSALFHILWARKGSENTEFRAWNTCEQTNT